MKLILSISVSLLISILFATAAQGQYIQTNQNGVKVYKIDLDRAPQERFKEVALDFKEDTVKAIRFYTGFVPKPLMWSIE
jgi:hypothetical protein